MRRCSCWLVFVLFLMMPALAFGQGVKAKTRGTKGNTEPVNLDKVADNLKFDNGMQLYKLKLYDRAIDVFGEYLEIFQDGIHRNEAYKCIGDIYFSRYDYQRAIKTYRRLFEEYSTTDDGVEAYFKIGLCYTKMGYDDKASEVFHEIVNDYPDSNYSMQAKTQIDLLSVLQDSGR